MRGSSEGHRTLALEQETRARATQGSKSIKLGLKALQIILNSPKLRSNAVFDGSDLTLHS